MTDTMRAIVLDAPGPPDALTIRELPVPTPAAGWVLIEVKAFGLNRSELLRAKACGYFDQSHLAHEWRMLAGSPIKTFRERV